MKWKNLKDNKCPKCSENLNVKEKLDNEIIKCTQCDFMISEGKYLDIRTDMVTKG
jgi:ribosomal protein L37AE/L43A